MLGPARAPLIAMSGIPERPRRHTVSPESFLLRLVASGGPARPHGLARFFVIESGGVRAGLRIRAVSPWPLLLAYTLVD